MPVTAPDKPRHRRQRQVAPKVTQADLARVGAFLKAMGATVAAVDVAPGKARIITTDGQGLTLAPDEADLDKELAQFRQKRDQGSP